MLWSDCLNAFQFRSLTGFSLYNILYFTTGPHQVTRYQDNLNLAWKIAMNASDDSATLCSLVAALSSCSALASNTR